MAFTLVSALASPAFAGSAPSARIHFSGGGIAFIAGINWGSGTLTYKGHSYALKVKGLSVGSIGANGYDAAGSVYHLKRLSDIEGTYSAVEASATVGGGAGVFDMKNSRGVEIRAKTTSAGLKLTLAPTGVDIELKR